MCATVIMLPMTYDEKLTLKVIADHKLMNLKNAARFASIESNYITMMTEMNIYQKIKKFNKKFIYGVGGK